MRFRTLPPGPFNENHSPMSLSRISRLSGLAYLLIFITGIYANFAVLEPMVLWGDPVQTFSNLREDPGTFQMAVWAFALMLAFDLFLVWGLYRLFWHAGPKLSLGASALRFVNVVFFVIAWWHLAGVTALLGPSPEAAPAGVTELLGRFDQIWLAGLVFFGLHLLVLSRLVIRSPIIPRFIGILLAIAGIGYLIDSFAQWWMPNYAEFENAFSLVVIVPGVIGELSLTFFLLFFARRFGQLEA